MAIRKKHQDKFVEKHGIKIGFMSFFTKAVSEALKLFPLLILTWKKGSSLATIL